jgi:hypothetical protein
MTSEERVEPAHSSPRDSRPTARGRDQAPTALRDRDDSVSSGDWVSPFTLPPLPALRRGRDHIDLLRSPDQSRQRGGSGTYYAAAWGEYMPIEQRLEQAQNIVHGEVFAEN